MRETLAVMWATLTELLLGTKEFASGFRAVGEYAHESAKSFVDEERQLREQRRLANQPED